MTTLTFPSDLTTNNNKFMTIRIASYFRRSIYEPPIRTQPTGAGAIGTIRLPIPHELTDSQSVQWSEDRLSPLVGAVLESAVRLRREERPNLSDTEALINNTVRTFTGADPSQYPGLESVRNLLVAGAAGAAVGTADAASERTRGLLQGAPSAISQYLGIGINPYLSTSFKTPKFKTHQFSWKMVPRNLPESNAIKNIIESLRKAQLPGVNSLLPNNLLFEYPDMLEIFLSPNQYLYNFKRCVIDSMSVNYAPASAPSFYDSNAPTAVELSIRLREIEMWTKRDYGATSTGPTSQPGVGPSTPQSNLQFGRPIPRDFSVPGVVNSRSGPLYS